MRCRQESNVSSSIPAAIRFLLDPERIVAFESAGVVGTIVWLDMAASLLAVDERPAVAELSAVDEVPPEDSIVSVFRSVAQPATMSPKKAIKMAFLSISAPPANCFDSIKKKGRDRL